MIGVKVDAHVVARGADWIGSGNSTESIKVAKKLSKKLHKTTFKEIAQNNFQRNCTKKLSKKLHKTTSKNDE